MKIKKNIVYVLVFVFVFLSFPVNAYASIYGDDITDYDIQEYDGYETVIYVLDGKINYL